MDTAVAFIIFNRPDTTQKVFEAIRRARPPRLYLIADGPRTPAEKQLTEATRAIAEQVDWPCTVAKFYSTANMGCRNRVITGLDAVFGIEDKAIIIEDDCLPDPSFFSFCETLLHRYQYRHDIMHIGGNNFQNGQQAGDGDYYFSRYAHIWGWATWQRAWRLYSHTLHEADFPESVFDHLSPPTYKQEEKIYWKAIYEVAGNPNFNSWDYNWLFTIWQHKGLAIVPAKNLVLNIGFGENSTHTRHVPALYRKAVCEKLETFKAPSATQVANEADKYTFYSVFYTRPVPLTLGRKIQWRLKKILNKAGSLKRANRGKGNPANT